MAKKEKTTISSKTPTNVNDVLIRLIDRIYDIINSGNIIGVIAVIILLIIWRLPPADLGKQINTIISLLASEKYYIFPLTVLLLFSVSLNFYQRKVYKLEIKRLVAIRKILMHGLKSEDLKPLDTHYSSDYNIEEI